MAGQVGRQALEQVHRVLEQEATFILEFANKRNLKSILRYMLGRQTWNPFSPEPIEFAALNFDFHPATIRAWLQVTGFVVERQLTVSHFRIGILKRLIPLGLLVWMDSLAQHTGNLWQYSPSVFVRAQARSLNLAAGRAAVEGSLWEQGAFFRCPACGDENLPDTPPELVCPSCGQKFQVKDGIYDMRVNPES